MNKVCQTLVNRILRFIIEIVKRVYRLTVLIGIGLGAGTAIIFIGNYFISSQQITDLAAKATILAGVLTFLGTIFTALYNEISSYYKDRSNNNEKKWNLVYPLLKQDYYPWINAALSLRYAISKMTMNNTSITANQVTHMLFLIAVFYGYRLRFIIGDGGLIVLSSISEEDKVNAAYKGILDSFGWAGDETAKRVSELQNLFISKDKKEDPYVLDKFENDINNTKSLQVSRDKLAEWLRLDSNRQTLDTKFENFVNTFKSGIDKVYSSWET
jgi:hypothetical protein